ncbi:uncharacterized protein J3D65DRAFT_644664 [Phyllosticta citribraziliensis]|uniref:Enoyl reductase (ER) domain-containing protein n=1 Tax=Phyllosticta citribraziliensis TaxID=989973 RepID=A0ABR1M028_9PEZI
MKAILIDHWVKSLSDLSASTIPSPPCGTNKLRIRVTHAAITHVDLLYAQGRHQNNRRHVKPPFVLGTEFAGVVLCASRTSSFRPGTRVFGFGLGSFAEEICVDELQVKPVPQRWTNAEACAVGGSAAVAYGALGDGCGHVSAGQSVLVLGASGGLGVAAIQVAQALGATVVGVAGGSEKEAVVKSLGAKSVNYRHDKWQEKVLELTGGSGVDVIFDPIGAVEDGLKCLKYGGKILVIGFAAREGIMEKVSMNKVLLKGASVIGYRFGEQSRRNPAATSAIWESTMALISQNKIRPVVYKQVYGGLDSVPKALQDVDERKIWGRAVVSVSEEDSLNGTRGRATRL